MAFKDGELYAVIIQDTIQDSWGDDESIRVWMDREGELYDDNLLTQEHSFMYDDY